MTEPREQTPERQRKSAAQHRLVMWIGAPLGLLLLIGVGLRLFVLELFRIPSGTMLPTVAVGEHVLVNKLERDAARGEVIVFRYPDNREQLFLKRVVARPGEVLEVVGGRPVIDGRLARRCRVGEIAPTSAAGGLRGTVYVEFLGEHAYLVLQEQKQDPKKTTCQKDSDCSLTEVCRGGDCGLLQGPYHVADGEVWVLGDNRDNSHDSRSWGKGTGAGVPLSDVIGLATSAMGPPKLPEGVDPSLTEALARCLASPPARP